MPAALADPPAGAAARGGARRGLRHRGDGARRTTTTAAAVVGAGAATSCSSASVRSAGGDAARRRGPRPARPGAGGARLRVRRPGPAVARDGRELLDRTPVFAALDGRRDRPPRSSTSPGRCSTRCTATRPPPASSETEYAQPALFAVQVGLAAVWRALGRGARAVVGHSVGEIAAPHVAGALTLERRGARHRARGRLMGGLPPGGAMAAVDAAARRTWPSVAGREHGLSIAAVNAPTATVLSGAVEAVGRPLRRAGDAAGRGASALAGRPRLPLAADRADARASSRGLAGLTLDGPRLPFVSTVTGATLDAEQASTRPTGCATRARRCASPTRSDARAPGTASSSSRPPPGAARRWPRRRSGASPRPPSSRPCASGDARRGRVVRSLADAHAAAPTVDWERFFAGTGARRVALPTYPFQRERFWLRLRPRGRRDARRPGRRAVDHPLPRRRARRRAAEGGETLLTGRLSLATHPGSPTTRSAGRWSCCPAPRLLELALRAGERGRRDGVERADPGGAAGPAGGRRDGMQVVGRGRRRGRATRRSRSTPARRRPDRRDEWTRNATRCPLRRRAPAGRAARGLAAARAPSRSTSPPLRAPRPRRLEYGPAFQGLTAAWRTASRVYAEVALPEERGARKRAALRPPPGAARRGAARHRPRRRGRGAGRACPSPGAASRCTRGRARAAGADRAGWGRRRGPARPRRRRRRPGRLGRLARLRPLDPARLERRAPGPRRAARAALARASGRRGRAQGAGGATEIVECAHRRRERASRRAASPRSATRSS